MIIIITLLGIASAVSTRHLSCLRPYEEEFQYLALYSSDLRAPHRFDIEIKDNKGAENLAADHLSRLDGNEYSLKDKNKAKMDKTEYEIRKSVKSQSQRCVHLKWANPYSF
ncbi:hypothetical protein Tco_0932858 [Tanacetum coccineum]